MTAERDEDDALFNAYEQPADVFVVENEQSYGPSVTADGNEDEGLDELAPLAHDRQSVRSLTSGEQLNRDRQVSSFIVPTSFDVGTIRRGWFSGRCSPPRLRGKNRWTIALALFAGTLLILSLISGSYVYNSKPSNGQSPPWYPTRMPWLVATSQS